MYLHVHKQFMRVLRGYWSMDVEEEEEEEEEEFMCTNVYVC